MSGHSKWATIKRQKGANDAKRGQLLPASKAISIAVVQGGSPDQESNFRLRLAIEAARTANMPKDNIERAIARVSGKQAESIEEATYEGFGPGGFSVVVEAVTDNKLRTVSEVKNVFNKNGGSMGAQGSVMYQFEKKGVITVAKDGKSIDDIFLTAADNGAEDIEEAGEEVLLYTKPEDVTKIKDSLSQNSLNVKTFELIFRPVGTLLLQIKDSLDKVYFTISLKL